MNNKRILIGLMEAVFFVILGGLIDLPWVYAAIWAGVLVLVYIAVKREEDNG